MKKFKKVLSTIMAASIVSGSVSAINALATSPRIYVDIVYEDANTPRADIYFENMPPLHSGGFHIVIGNGWDTAKNISGGVKATRTGTTSAYSNTLCYEDEVNNDNEVFMYFANTNPVDFNGRFYSIYLEKTESYNWQNASINLLVKEGDFLVYYTGSDLTNEVNCLGDFAETNPIMLRADEYMIGDADGNHRIDARDATAIYSGIDSVGFLSVHDIRNNYKDFFARAEAPAAPDADQNGYINSKDGDDVLSYYASSATGGTYEGSIGSISVYETYND